MFLSGSGHRYLPAMRQMIKQYGADQIRNVAVRKHLERVILFLLAYLALHGPHLKITPWVKVFRIIPEFRILRLTFHRKSASKC